MVAAAAALLQKVALRSASWAGAAGAHARAEALRLRAEELVELDSIAYLDFVAAVRSGGDVEPARKKTIEVPQEIAEAADGVIELAHELERSGNQNLRADATAAAILAQAAGRTAAMLVRVNGRARRPAAPAPPGGRGHARARSSDTRQP